MAKRITLFIITLVVFCMAASMFAYAGGDSLWQLPIIPENPSSQTGTNTKVPDKIEDAISDNTSGDVDTPDSGFVTPPVDIDSSTNTTPKNTTTKTTTTKTDASSYTVTLSTTKYTYNDKAKKPKVTVKNKKGKKLSDKYYTVKYSNNKKVGTATVKVTYKGKYKGSSKKTFKIVPKSTKISKLTKKSKSFKITWKKQSTQTTGYQIQYATNSKFTKNKKTVTVKKNTTTSKTVKDLKGKKKYYVKVRTYKVVDGKKYYSSWSDVKTVTTKK